MPFSFPQLTMADEKPSLLTISTETRLMIYDHLIKCTGTVTIFPQYDLAHHVDKQTIRLLHINRQIRLEVQVPEVEDDTGRVKIYRRWPGVYARDTGFTTNTMIELPSKEEMDAAVKTGIEARQSKRKPTPSKVKKRAKRRARSETARRTVDAQMASSLL